MKLLQVGIHKKHSLRWQFQMPFESSDVKMNCCELLNYCNCFILNNKQYMRAHIHVVIVLALVWCVHSNKVKRFIVSERH